MIHELIPQSVEIKTTVFDPPARLINHMELLCAIGMAFHQAGADLPEIPEGAPLKESVEALLPPLSGNPGINPRLLQVIQDYIYKSGEVADQDALLSMKLGYEYQ